MIAGNIYLSPFLTSFLFSILLLCFIIWISKFFSLGFRNREGDKSGKVSRLGGVAIIGAFLISVFWDKNLEITPNLWGIIFGSLYILIYGLVDDLKNVVWRWQLFIQIVLVGILFILGNRIYHIVNPFGGDISGIFSQNIFFNFLIVLGWFLLFINSMNWMDGADGLSGGVSLTGAVTLFILVLKPEVNQPPIGILSMALAGAFLGFLIFNFHPARILAGTSGSSFMGFSLAYLAIFAGEKMATAILVMIIPVIDFVWVIFERLKNGNSIFQPDRRHIHHKLMEIGWSHEKISLVFYGITLIFSLVALNFNALGKFKAIVAASIVMIALLGIINRKILRRNRENEEV